MCAIISFMKSVVICGSRRYTDGIREFEAKLHKKGIVVYSPILNTNKHINELPEDLKRYAFLGLTWHHLEFIRKADVVFIYNKDGYMGNSTTIELEAAVALGKPIYSLEQDTTEQCRKVLIDEVIGSVDKLVKLLK